MVDWQEVVETADELVAQGRTVSVRAVRSALREKGSHRDVGPLVKRWKESRKFSHRPEVDGVPITVQRRHNDALAALWAEAQIFAIRDLNDERARLNAAIQANDEVRDEALQTADMLEEQVSVLRIEIDGLKKELSEQRKEVNKLRGHLEKRDARLDRVRSEEFWNRLMIEVAELLPVEGGMTLEEILPRLRDSAHREAANHKERITKAILRKKMLTRVAHKKFFELVADDRFARRPEAKR